jgi:hypothetical protein
VEEPVDVSPLAADTADTAHAQCVRAAEEETKRERLRQTGKTQRLGIIEGKSYLVLVALLLLMAVRLMRDHTVDPWLVVLVVAVLSGRAAAGLLKQVLRRFHLID